MSASRSASPTTSSKHTRPVGRGGPNEAAAAHRANGARMHKQLTLDDVAHPHPITLHVDDIPIERNRLTCAFRPILALPHLILVGGPAALALSIVFGPDSDPDMTWGAGGGVLGVAAMAAAMISWFAIVFTGRMPKGLWKLNTFYLHW